MGNRNSGRRPHLDPPVEWKITIPTSVASRIEIALVDPARGKARFGARAQLITQLLRDWLAQQAAERDFDPTPWCHQCGAAIPEQCTCGPIADNN